MPDVFTRFKNLVAPSLACACHGIPPQYEDDPDGEAQAGRAEVGSLRIREVLDELKVAKWETVGM